MTNYLIEMTQGRKCAFWLTVIIEDYNLSWQGRLVDQREQAMTIDFHMAAHQEAEWNWKEMEIHPLLAYLLQLSPSS